MFCAAFVMKLEAIVNSMLRRLSFKLELLVRTIFFHLISSLMALVFKSITLYPSLGESYDRT